MYNCTRKMCRLSGKNSFQRKLIIRVSSFEWVIQSNTRSVQVQNVMLIHFINIFFHLEIFVIKAEIFNFLFSVEIYLKNRLSLILLFNYIRYIMSSIKKFNKIVSERNKSHILNLYLFPDITSEIKNSHTN